MNNNELDGLITANELSINHLLQTILESTIKNKLRI